MATGQAPGASDSGLRVEIRDGVLALAGPLVFDTVPAAWARSLALLPTTGNLVIDLGGVAHADSAALALVMEWRRLAHTRGMALELRGLPAQLRALAAATGLEDIVR